MPDDMPSIQRYIADACEGDLARHGDSYLGAGYTKSPAEAEQRYALMLGVIRETDEPIELLDFGCGVGHLLDHLDASPTHRHVRYTGLDLSARYLAAARSRHPQATFVQMDVLDSDEHLAMFDYVVMNGVFNFRGAVAEPAMRDYWQRLTSVVFRHCRRGVAFNVMSQLVDWQRDELFHLPFDAMADFVGRSLSPHFVVRHDYGAREYTTFVYRTPSVP